MTAHDNGRASAGGAAGLDVAIIQMNSQADKGANVAAALDLIDRAAATGARIIVTANPGCLLHLRAGLAAHGSDVQVRHIVELLDEASRDDDSVHG